MPERELFLKPEAKKEEKKDKEIEQAQKGIGTFFDDNKDGQKRVENILSKIEPFLKSDLIDGDKVRQSLRGCSAIKEREEFIEKVLSSLEPISDLKKNNPEAFEEIERRVFVEGVEVRGFKKINEILSYGVNEDFAHIHLAPAGQFGISVLKMVRGGLEELAKIVKENKEIKRVEAISWIVADHPKILERLGFTVVGEIDEEIRRKYHANDNGPISRATISREDFLSRYLKE
ncbi:MAG: hypothetical protein Q7R84_01360 [bacterium]|nr:hypothetical protein [bacterium]